MKYLVLAICVCVANAASFGAYTPWKQQQVSRAVAQAVVSPPEYYNIAPVVAAKTPVVSVVPVVPKAVVPIVPVVPKPVVPVVPKPVVPVVPKVAYHDQDAFAPIVRSDNEVSADGFNYLYETGNGISAQASGVLKKIDNSDILVMEGGYRYTAPDGTPVVVSYVADENGYQPQSDLLPVGPPVPEAILHSLEYIRAHPSKDNDKY